MGANVQQGGGRMVQVTDSARSEIHRLIERDGRPGIGLRLGVRGGGCSGLSYAIDFDEPREGDHRQEEGDFSIFIDRKSSLYIRGLTLDFHSGLQNHGFKFINPNAQNTCGCGESFSV
jgi:iron-sulfur cluster assembly protein